jgi:D-xylose transport system substrate-binding protein
MQSSITRLAGLGLAAGLALTSVAACGSSSSSGGASSSGGGGSKASGKKIALLLPESKTARYESKDRPLFTAAIKAQCPDCQIIYSNADQDAAKQQQQAESALTQGANVLVLDPVDSKAAASIANSAKSSKVPVIAYDRFISGAPVDYYVSFDNEKVGQLQGQTLVDLMKKAGKSSGKIVMINGSPTDNNAGQFKKGAHSVLDKSGYTVAAEYDTPDWSPDKAQQWMESQLTNVKSGLVGVYAANDGTAGGAIAALKGGGVNPLPPVTGQDAELAAIQRIIAGDQAMTVYKAIKPEAEDAAKAAIALASGQKPDAKSTYQSVPSTLLVPVAVTKGTVKDTVVKDGVYKVNEICAGEFAKACAAAGLS